MIVQLALESVDCLWVLLYNFETYKILNNIDKVQYEQILPLSQTTTRGHSKKLYKKEL
jgi:hypothetical protein